ncbi:neocarzinostatin apoprotein domain-containing protein [Rhodococcus sp. NPDC055112]
MSGTGFKPGTPLYLAQTIAKPAVGFPTTYGQESKVTTDAAGAFTAEVQVARTFKGVDCLETACYLATFAAFPSIFTDRSQDVWVPISFAAQAEVAVEGSGAAPGSGGPVTAVAKTAAIAAGGEAIRVSGTGFSAAGAGLYVGLAETGRYNPLDADSFASTVYVRTAEIQGGAWSVDLPVQARVGATDCLARPCAIYTLAAHGSPDRSQDTVTPVTFAPAVTTAAPAPAAPAPAAAGSPVVTASKIAGLNAAGDTVTVSGTGFAGTGSGIYVGVAQTDRFSTTDASAFQDAEFIRASDMSAGAWSTTLNVAGAFGDSDCTRNACAIYTLAAHGSSDRSQDTVTPISFVGAAPAVTTPAPAPAGVAAVTVAKTEGLEPNGEKVTVSGTGFSGGGAGIYVGLVEDDKYSATDATAWITTAYLTPDKIVGGNWSTELELRAVQGDADCTRSTCSVYTVAAHGSSDRSQDTRTPVAFGGVPATAAPTTVPVPDTAVENLSATSTESDDDSGSAAGWIVGGAVAAIVAAGAGVVAMRRRV